MEIAFVTHNRLGARCIEALDEDGANVRTVYTRPQTHGLAGQMDLRAVAERVGARYRAVDTMNDDQIVEDLRTQASDLLFVVGWSQLVEQRVIDTATEAAIGMHPAPLPRGRGRAPVAWTLIKGYESTELTMFKLVSEADAGAVYGRHSINVARRDDAESLHEKIRTAGEQLIHECYPGIADGSLSPTPQNDEAATWWPRRRPHHGLIDWTQSAEQIHNWIRGQTHPYPGAFSFLDSVRVTIWEATPPTGERVYANPGEIVECRGDRLAVAAWEEVIEIERIQFGERDEQPAAALVADHGVDPGTMFENARDRLATD